MADVMKPLSSNKVTTVVPKHAVEVQETSSLLVCKNPKDLKKVKPNAEQIKGTMAAECKHGSVVDDVMKPLSSSKATTVAPKHAVEVQETSSPPVCKNPKDLNKVKPNVESIEHGSIVDHVKRSLSSIHKGTRLALKEVVEVPAGKVPPICNNLKDLKKVKPLTLRSKLETICSRTVELKQFDPNFFARRGYIWCRFPGCKKRMPRQNMSGGQTQKEDLYLCQDHRRGVEREVEEMCRKEGVSVPMNDARAGDFKGYTSLIGELESEYLASIKPFAPQFGGSECRAILQDVCLNTRNYVIIVNALLNPCSENEGTALPAPLTIFETIMLVVKNLPVILDTLRGLVDLMVKVMECILFAFGVIYTWIRLPLMSSPGAQVGTGIGFVLGLTGYAVGPGFGTLTAIGLAVSGGLIGNGLYNMIHGYGNSAQGYQRYQRFSKSRVDNSAATTPSPHGRSEDESGLGSEDETVREDESGVYRVTGDAWSFDCVL